jgi:hypothetical protein
MWWSKPKPEFDSVAHLRGTLAQTNAIVDAEHQGRKAWRISVVNGMLAEEYRAGPRRYRWSVSELSQLSGVELQTISERENETANSR